MRISVVSKLLAFFSVLTIAAAVGWKMAEPPPPPEALQADLPPPAILAEPEPEETAAAEAPAEFAEAAPTEAEAPTSAVSTAGGYGANAYAPPPPAPELPEGMLRWSRTPAFEEPDPAITAEEPASEQPAAEEHVVDEAPAEADESAAVVPPAVDEAPAAAALVEEPAPAEIAVAAAEEPVATPEAVPAIAEVAEAPPAVPAPLLHLGSYYTEPAAARGWKILAAQAKALLADARPAYVGLDIRGTHYVRLFARLPDGTDAAERCAALAARKMFCRVDG